MEEPIIICPVCGQAYLPAEIFMPDDLLGKPTDIFKTSAGKIDFYLGKEPDLTEEYTCDNCGTRLSVKARLSFDVQVKEKTNSSEHVTHFNRQKKAVLEEESLFD